MSDTHEKKQLLSLFYAFTFFLLGIFTRHLSIRFNNQKRIVYPALYIIGAILGLIIKKLDQAKDPILGQCGPSCIQSLYLPIFFFDVGFTSDTQQFKRKIILFTFFILIPIWVVSIALVTVIGVYFVPSTIQWRCYAVLALFSMSPDVQCIRLVLHARFSPCNPDLKMLLEFEALVCAGVASIVVDSFQSQGKDAMYMPFEIVFSIIISFGISELAIAWLKRIHNDIVIQATISICVIFITFCIAASIGAPAGLCILVLSVCMMRAKTSISEKAIDSLSILIYIMRYGLATVVIGTAGMEITDRVMKNFAYWHIGISLLMYFTLFAVRFVVLLALWPVYRHYCLPNINDALTMSACNLQGPYNTALSYSFLYLQKGSSLVGCANETLFILANYNIFLSFLISMPFTNFLLNAVSNRRLDIEKMEMIFNCANVLNELKASFTDVLRKLASTADADWELVTHRTRIKKGFFKMYGVNKFVLDALPVHSEAINKQLRRDSIRFLLRSQRRDLGDQFEKGLVSATTTRTLTSAIMKAHFNKSLLNAERLLKDMGPGKPLSRFKGELANDMKIEGNTIRNTLCWILLCFTLFIFTWRALGNISNYNENFPRAEMVHWIYNLIFLLVLVVILIKYTSCHKRNALMYWIVFATAVLTGFECTLDSISTLDYVIANNTWGNPKHFKSSEFAHGNIIFVHYLLGVLAFIILVMRVACIGYGLSVVKIGLATLVHSLMENATYAQCEAGLSFIQITRDVIHQLPDTTLDNRIMRRLQIIMHQENLSARQQMGLLEILSPGVMSTLKAYIASRTILNSQLHMVTTMHNEGFIGDGESCQLHQIIQEKIKVLTNIKLTSKPPDLRQLLTNLPQMTKNESRVSHLVKHGKVINFKPGEVMVRQVNHLPGLFIILNGLARGECWLAQGMHVDSSRKGPVYYSKHRICVATKTHETTGVELTDFYSSGCVVGDRHLLTERAGHKTVRSVTDVEAFFVPSDVLFDLMGGKPKWNRGLSTLEQSLWRCISIRMAGRLMQGVFHADTLLTHRKVYHMLERSDVIFAASNATLKLDSKKYMAIMLIHGSLRCADNERHYVGPCFLPCRTTQVIEYIVDGGRRNVLVVLPSDQEHNSMQEEIDLSFLRHSQVGIEAEESEADSDELTSSSDASDGIPRRRYRDTLAVNISFTDPMESAVDPDRYFIREGPQGH